MKSKEFVKLSQVNLPLDEIKLEDGELIAIKGGKNKDALTSSGSGDNCECSCGDSGNAGDGDNCNCTCG